MDKVNIGNSVLPFREFWIECIMKDANSICMSGAFNSKFLNFLSNKKEN